MPLRTIARAPLGVLIFAVTLMTPAIQVFGADALQPAAFTQEVQAAHSLQRVEVFLEDRAELEREDLQREADGLPPRYAVPNPVLITPATDGTWETLEDGRLIWRLRVASPGAESINLGFARYGMPPEGRMFIYATDGSRVVRPFTAADNEAHGELWTPPLPSDDVIVEVTLPAAERPLLDLELTSINPGYRGFGEAGGGLRSGSCNVDVVCSEGDGWRDQIQSVAVISTGGSTFCTGFMVNNTANDRTPYFMTARHCGISSSNAASLVVFWNFQNSTCRPPGSGASGGPGDGSLGQFQTGSIYRASYSPSDFTLVELDDDPDPAFEVFFAGWDRSSNDATMAVAIHHPNTDEKRISFEFDPTTTASYLGASSPGDGTHVRVADWDVGTTEPGSSGSPLFDQNGRIIGQLHGGYAACGNDLADWYGRISVSWTGGGSAGTRLSDWLDPGNTGAMAINGTGLAAPPVTADVDVMLDTNTTRSIALVGWDDNNDPLTFLVQSLPQHGVIYDGADLGAGPILSVPHALSGRGGQIVYEPATDYIGYDDFTFMVNDGGTPPDGGDSNTSTVSIRVVHVAPQILSSGMPNGQVGENYGPWQIDVAGGEPPLTWELVTDVPYDETSLNTNGFLSVGNAMEWNRDDGFWQYDLPFTFPFYGEDETSIRIWSNGFVDFGALDGSSYANTTNLLIANRMIAPLWDDLKTNVEGTDIHIDESVPGEVTIRWEAVTYSGNYPVNAAVTLAENGAIAFHYGPGNDPISATVGISNGDGENYHVAAYNPATALTEADSLLLKQPDQLSAGLEISSDGEVSGIPAAPGTFDPLVRVTDSLGRSDERTVTCIVAAFLGDFDADGDIDLDDFALMAGCLDGPAAGGCAIGDLDGDSDVDLIDFADFQALFGNQ